MQKCHAAHKEKKAGVRQQFHKEGYEKGAKDTACSKHNQHNADDGCNGGFGNAVGSVANRERVEGKHDASKENHHCEKEGEFEVVGKAENCTNGDKREADKVHDFAAIKDIREGTNRPLKGKATENGESHSEGDLEEGEVIFFSINGAESIKGANHHTGDDAAGKSDGRAFDDFVKRDHLWVVHFGRFVG